MATCPTIRSANRSASGEDTRLPQNGVGTLRLSGRSETRRCQPPRSVRSDSSWRARSGMASRRWAGGNRLGSSRKFLASSPSILQVADCVRNDDASAHATPVGARLGFSSRADARSDDRSISVCQSMSIRLFLWISGTISPLLPQMEPAASEDL
jgi:hypothetical protein